MQSDESIRIDALYKALNHLLESHDRLEQRITRIESALQLKAPDLSAAEPLPAEKVESPVIAEPLTVERSEPTQEPAAPVEALPKAEATLESKVGLTFVNRIGAITLVLGIAFFFKWAVDNNWIGPAGRVILGVVAGFATLGAADFLWRRKQQVFAQGITATGIAILYLSLYAAFNFYHLIPQTAAFLLMFATTAMAAVLALRYQSFAIAALGLAAAFVTPLLLSTGEDHAWFLFSYLLLLNFAASELAKRGGWPRLELISFTGTALIYGGWLIFKGDHPGNRLVGTLAPLAFTAQRWRTEMRPLFSASQFLTLFALAFIWDAREGTFLLLALLVTLAGLAYANLREHRITVLTAFLAFWIAYVPQFDHAEHTLVPFLGISCGFVLFTLWTWWHLVWKRSTPSTLALSIFGLNGVFYYALSYNALRIHEHLWLGPLAAVVAAVYLFFGIFLHRQAEETDADKRPVLLALGIAISFLTLAIPIQFQGFTITIAWAIQGAALAWIAARFKSERMLLGPMVVLALVAGRLMLFETEMLPDPASYSLVWNARFFSFAVSAVAMLLAAYWTSPSKKDAQDGLGISRSAERAGLFVPPVAARIRALCAFMQPVALGEYLAGNIFLLWGLCLEVIGWAARSAEPTNRLSAETIAISILFGVYAVILVSVGVARRAVIHRLTGLGLIGIVILKLYFFDVWQLARPFQIAAFVVLGILLLSTSFLYSHFRRLIGTWWKDEKPAT